MNIIYIENGIEEYEDIIKDIKYGLFVKKLGGGIVNFVMGEYNFVVMEGYMIEDGKLIKFVRGVMLIGYGVEII